jgi:transaldolase
MNRHKKIAPPILAADFSCLSEEIRAVEASGGRSLRFRIGDFPERGLQEGDRRDERGGRDRRAGLTSALEHGFESAPRGGGGGKEEGIMKRNPIQELQRQGQRLWLDYIQRALITSGELQRLIDEGLTGITSNPTIFEEAISGSGDYDAPMRALIAEGKGALEIIDALTIQDIQMAADRFRPVYDRTRGEDGFVSIELNPNLADRTDETIAAAKALHPRLDRPNVMIKVPATGAGIPAIEALTAEGISINVTLIFSIEQYEKVARAYLAGMKRRLERGEPIGSVRSVASLFVSRFDTVVDRLLDARIQAAQTEEERRRLRGLLGKVGVANAKRVYQKFKELFQGEGSVPLQRLLFGSTGTKNPHYSDVLYVEELIGPNTINTVPQKTLNAFRDHGRVRPSLEEDLEGARTTLEALATLGIDLAQITQELQEKGVAAFADSYGKLIDCVARKSERLRSGRAA